MKKLVWIVVFAIILLGGVWIVLSWRARQTVFQVDGVVKYEGMYQRRKDEATKLWIDPPEGVPFFAPLSDRDSFDPEYSVTEMPEQERLLYAVGRVVGWEEIEGSGDKYLVLEHDAPDVQQAKYRALAGK